MALHWDTRSIKDCDELYPPTKDEDGVELMNPITWCIIMTSMNVNLGDLTEANVDEWIRRQLIYQQLFGAHLHDGDKNPVFLEPKHIRDHIGLKVNTRVTTKAQFRKHMFECVERDAFGAAERRKNMQITKKVGAVTETSGPYA